MIEYLHRDQLISEADLPADVSLLDYLRNQRDIYAVKEGCASGDCGACTVALGRVDTKGDLHYQSVNACICPAAELHGSHLVTAADLAGGEQLHPVQQAFVDQHASQCGFCTPGFIVSAFTLLEQLEPRQQPSVAQASQAIAGNLCRCTGYGPIVRAVQAAAEGYQSQINREAVTQCLAQIGLQSEAADLLLPQTLAELSAALNAYPDRELIAGGTDLMLEVTQRLVGKPAMIGLSRLGELQLIERAGDVVHVGAGVTFTQLHGWAEANLPELAELLLHIGSEQIRNRGTLGGNIGTASPIGDLPPVLLALGAKIRLWSPDGERELCLHKFFTGYRTTALGAGEIIHSISFLLPPASQQLVIEKVSKRREDDISAVLLAMLFEIDGGRLRSLKIGLGGVAATPFYAVELAQAVANYAIEQLDYQTLRALVDRYLQPMDDLRASADYRLHCTAALILDALQQGGRSDEA